LFEGQVADATTAIALVVRRAFDVDRPFVLSIDRDTLTLTLDEAARLSKEGWRIETRLVKGEAPKAAAVFQHRIAFENGDISVFELGAADPTGIYVAWDKKRVVLGLDHCGILLHVLARIAEDVPDVRRWGQPAPSRNSAVTNISERWRPRLWQLEWWPDC
jgi:hypothetical protein